jgi:hypothetical protein
MFLYMVDSPTEFVDLVVLIPILNQLLKYLFNEGRFIKYYNYANDDFVGSRIPQYISLNYNIITNKDICF